MGFVVNYRPAGIHEVDKVWAVCREIFDKNWNGTPERDEACVDTSLTGRGAAIGSRYQETCLKLTGGRAYAANSTLFGVALLAGHADFDC
jgi:hypothetical protein